MEAKHTLAIRRRGSKTWSAIDQRSEQGRYLLSLLEHPRMEKVAMSTATAMPIDTGPRLHLVPDELKAKVGLRVRALRVIREGRDRVYRTTQGAWTWARETFLDKAYALVKDVASWILDKARWLGSYIGTAGGAGLGLLAVTTKAGRWVLSNTVGRVWGWFKKAASWVFDKTLGVLDYLGTPGRWVANRLIDVANFGSDVVDKAKDFYDRNLAKHFVLGSTAMKIGQVAGVSLVASQVLTIATFTPLRWLVFAGVAIWTAFTVKGPLEKASNWLKEQNKANKVRIVEQAAEEASAEMTTAVNEATDEGQISVDAMVGNGYQEAVAEANKVMEHAPKPVVPQNREARRAAAREARVAEAARKRDGGPVIA